MATTGTDLVTADGLREVVSPIAQSVSMGGGEVIGQCTDSEQCPLSKDPTGYKLIELCGYLSDSTSKDIFSGKFPTFIGSASIPAGRSFLDMTVQAGYVSFVRAATCIVIGYK